MVVAFHLFVYLPFFDLNRGEVCVIIMLCGLVISLETVNSAIERAVDCTGEISRRAGAAKDIAAGAVLVAAMVSVTGGVILLWLPPSFVAFLCFFFFFLSFFPFYFFFFVFCVFFFFFFLFSN